MGGVEAKPVFLVLSSRFAPAMTTSNSSACEILNTVCTRLSPVLQKGLAFFLNLQPGHAGSERNCRSNGKRLNLKDVSSCQTDEISPMVKNWTAAASRNARECAKTSLVNL